MGIGSQKRADSVVLLASGAASREFCLKLSCWRFLPGDGGLELVSLHGVAIACICSLVAPEIRSWYVSETYLGFENASGEDKIGDGRVRLCILT